MTSTALKALQDANLANNRERLISAAKLREVTTELIKKSGGWGDYSNSAVSAQSISATTWTVLTNDAAGEFTDETFLPYYSSGLFASNEIDLTDIPLGAIITVRFDTTTTITTNNTDVLLRADFKDSEGTTSFTQVFSTRSFKTQASYSNVDLFTFYVGSSILGGSVALEAYGDNAFQIKFNGVLITIP